MQTAWTEGRVAMFANVFISKEREVYKNKCVREN